MLKTMIKKVLLVALLSIVGTVQLSAQETSKAGTTAAQFLRIPAGPAGTGMGGAITANIFDVSSMFWNPAGLADVRGNQMMFEYTDWFIDLNHTFFAAAMPVSDKGSIGLNVIALTMDEFEETNFQFPEGTGRKFNAYSVSVGVTYAHQLFEGFRAGVNLKYVREQISESNASTIAFDVGTLYETPFAGIRFGVSITNVGGDMQMFGDDLIAQIDLARDIEGNYEGDAYLRTDAFELPLMLKVGLAWDAYDTEQLRATVTVDGNVPNDNVQSISVGTEIAFLDETFFLRGGLPNLGLQDRIINFTGGVGVNYDVTQSLQFRFGYSLQDYDYLGIINKLGLAVAF